MSSNNEILKEIDWDGVYKTKEWKDLKHRIAHIQFECLGMSEDGKCIEANLSSHTIAQFIYAEIKSLKGVKDAEIERLKKFIEWAFNDDNPFLFNEKTGRYIQACGNSTSWSFEQLLELFNKQNP